MINSERDVPFVVGVDLDAVSIDILPTWCAFYNQDYKDSLKPEQVLDWNMADFVKEECGFSVYKYLNDPRLYWKALPVPGALEGIQALRDMGATVLFVTSSYDGTIEPKIKWLRRFGVIPDEKTDPLSSEVVKIKNKHLLKLDVMIDDYIENLRPLDCEKVLFPAPYNAQFREEEGLVVAEAGWGDIPEIINELWEQKRERKRVDSLPARTHGSHR